MSRQRHIFARGKFKSDRIHKVWQYARTSVPIPTPPIFFTCRVAAYHIHDFQTAKSALEACHTLSPDQRTLASWMRKVDQELAKQPKPVVAPVAPVAAPVAAPVVAAEAPTVATPAAPVTTPVALRAR